MLQTLPQYEKVSVHVKVLSLLKAEQVGQENKIKRDVILADHTATAKVVLWEEHMDSLQEGIIGTFSCQRFQIKETSFNSKK